LVRRLSRAREYAPGARDKALPSIPKETPMRGRTLCLAAGLVAAASWSACKSTEQRPPADDARVQTLEEQLQAAKQDAAAMHALLDETNARLERLAKERDDRARDQAARLDALEHALAQHPGEPKPQEPKPQEPKPQELGKPQPALAVAHRSPDDAQPDAQPDNHVDDHLEQLRELREQLQRLREQLQQELRARGQTQGQLGAPRNCAPSRQTVDRHCTPTRTQMTKRETPPETKGKKVID
jgi:hypothetical protein